MNKKNLITIIAILCIVNANGQSTKKGNNEIIIHPQELITNLFKPLYYQPTYDNSLYIFSYRRIFAKNNALRLGLNFNNSTNNGTNNDTFDNKYKNNKFNIGIGYERYKMLTKAWKFNYGADVIYKSSLSNTENNSKNYYIKYNSKSEGWGLYPFIGTIINLNARISLGLETGIELNQLVEDSYSYYKNNGTITETKNRNTSNNVDYISPKLNFRIRL